MTVYRMMLESCLTNGASQGLEGTEAYRRIKEKYQVLSLAPQHYNGKNDQLYLLQTILMLSRW